MKQAECRTSETSQKFHTQLQIVFFTIKRHKGLSDFSLCKIGAGF